MLLRLFSGLFALAFALLLAQVPGFFIEKQSQLADRLVDIKTQITSSNQMAASAGMSLEQFAQSLRNHPDPSFQTQGDQIVQTLRVETENLESLAAFKRATAWNKLPLLFLHHRTLRRLPIEREQLIELPRSEESYCYGLAGFIIGIFFFSILIFFGMSLKKLYKLRQARKLLASRGYGY